MFFEPQYWEKGEALSLNKTAVVEGVGYAKEVAEALIAEQGTDAGSIRKIRFVRGMPEGARVGGEEAYALLITAEEAVLYGMSERAEIYAAETLLQMANHEGLRSGRLEDAPDCEFRGYRVYLPGRNAFDDFKKMVDTIVYYKYNYISLEVGGAMEYKRHPEINEKWLEFVADNRRYSGRTAEIQNTCPWAKNSIHTDNGEGDVLTRDEVRELIAYCRKRGLEVYPEAPTLSHTDYICLAHPEIAERQDDPYPDTYCPYHPDTYKLVFDVLEEVIEVFQPKLINIGHDEFYSMCVCERCKDKKPHEVFAYDVTKIHDFLAERGIRTAMWGDKLLPVVTNDGRTYGGAGSDRLSSSGKYVYFPPTFYCQFMLPRDILMLHWYYSFGIQYDYVYHTQGYEAVYGNMAVSCVDEWRHRRQLGIKGGACSNWGCNDPEYMQRNGQYANLIFGAFALWSKDYDNHRMGELLGLTAKEAYHLCHGNVQKGTHIEITHTTDLYHKYLAFWCGYYIEDEKYHMGNYKVTYTDGTTALLEVKYGKNISNEQTPCACDADNFDHVNLDCNPSTEIFYSTIPMRLNGKTWYKTAYRNPYPEKTIESVVYQPDTEAKVEILEVKY
ncbi:MAG: family 20 glycosylhydrolase [Clostridia bacterium]|nr:family 20 glycosylhydrolase [Clostridia bacterium]